MLSSGNGRHRRPKPTPAAVVSVATAAAAGAGMALPLFGATAAQAADTGTWDKVAICETGGLWSANTGNGFFGGLAITQTTWDEYGGDRFAARPDLASIAQQITVAEKILADLGPDAWPGCEDGTGLLKDTAPPAVDPGASASPVAPLPGDTPTATPTTPAGGSGVTTGSPSGSDTGSTPGSGAGSTTGSAPGATTGSTTGSAGSGSSATPSSPSTPSGATGGSTTAPTGSATDPGAPTAGTPSTAPGAPSATPPGGATGAAPPGQADGTPPPAGTGAATAPVSGRHGRPYSPTDEQLAAADRASRTEVFSTTDPGDADPAGQDAPGKGAGSAGNAAHNGGNSGTSDSASDPGTYAVGSGDSLAGIASAHHVDGGWRALYDVNHRLIGDDPNLIKPGQILNLG